MRYPYTVYQTQVEEHFFWIAECPILKGCVGQGETLEDAVKELEINEQEWLDTAVEFSIEIPPIPVEQTNEYSGKFTVRVAPHVHKKAVELAKNAGISLNQYVNDAIVAQNASITTSDYVLPVIKEAIKKMEMVKTESFINKTNQSYSTSPVTTTNYRLKSTIHSH